MEVKVQFRVVMTSPIRHNQGHSIEFGGSIRSIANNILYVKKITYSLVCNTSHLFHLFRIPFWLIVDILKVTISIFEKDIFAVAKIKVFSSKKFC